MNAKQVMTTAVISVHRDTSVPEIAELLANERISAVPVLDSGGNLVGIVSEDDLLHREEFGNERRPSWWLGLFDFYQERAKAFVRSQGRTAADVMTRDVVVVEPDTSLKDIARILESRRIKRVPVVSDGKMVGIVSRANLLHGLATAPVWQTDAADDESRRKAILDTLKSKAGLGGHNINVTVSEGDVHLWGTVYSEEERRAVTIAVESVQGTRIVEDNLRVVLPVDTLPWGI